MKKLFLILILLIAVSTQAQDTIHKYIDYGTPKQVHYIGIIKGNDTLWKEVGKGSSQGFKEQTDTLELQTELQNVQKLYEETYEAKKKDLQKEFENRLKELEAKDPDLLMIRGVIFYLDGKLQNERKKK